MYIQKKRCFLYLQPIIAGAFLLLSGCTTQSLRPDPALLAAQSTREQLLAQHSHWALKARIAVSDGEDGGSGTLEWQQDNDQYRFTMHAPVTGKTWVLTGREGYALLEGLQPQPIEGTNAAVMLQKELGWDVPVVELAAWVLGARAAGHSRLSFRPDGLLAELSQGGWKVEYLDYDQQYNPPLPKKIFASHGKNRIRMVIQYWDFE